MNSIRPSKCALHIVASCGVLLFACAASGEEKPKGYEVITGFDAAPQSLYWYDEAIVALNHDMAKDGFLFRMYGSLAFTTMPARTSPAATSTASFGSST